MRKSVKICVISGLVCLILGIGVSVSAAAMGATTDQFRGPVIHFMNEGMGDIVYSQGLTDMEDTLSFTGIEKLEIDGDRGNIRIVNSDDPDKITVSYAQRKGRVKIEQNGSTLKVECKWPHNRFWGRNDIIKDFPEAEIAIPYGYSFKEVDLDLGTSECTIESITAGKLDIDAGVGNVEIRDGNVGYMDIDGAVGNITYEGSLTGNADVDCGVGNLEMTLNGKETDFNYDINGGIGDVTVGQNHYSGMSFTQKIDNRASKNMDLDCSVGSVNISFTE